MGDTIISRLRAPFEVGGGVRELLKRSHTLRLAARRTRLRTRRPRVESLGGPASAKSSVARVLMASGSGAFLDGLTIDSLVAVALQERDVEVHGLLCDSALPACQECVFGRTGGAERMAARGPQGGLCRGCFEAGASTYETIGVTVHGYGELLSADDRRQAVEFAREADLDAPLHLRFNDTAVGEHAVAGALRYFGRATFEREPLAEPVLRRFLEAAALASLAMDALLDRVNFDTVVVNHGIYVPQGVVVDVARRRGVRVVTWAPAYRRQTVIFSHGDSYHHTMMTEPTSSWEDIEWSDTQRERTLTYLKSRWTGAEDWLHFTGDPNFETSEIERECGVDFSRPCVGLLTNVMWDAQVIYPQNAFTNMLDWCVETIRWFETRPELQLLIRVHPAEIKGYVPSRQPIIDELHKAFGGSLPANVFVIPPNSNASTYAAMLRCNAALIYATKTGVELSALGLPIIVAGEAWIRNKGITHDASTRDEYLQLLEMLPFSHRLDAATTDRAQRYAFHFFFRRMIPLEVVKPATGAETRVAIGVEERSELKEGASRGMDVICDGIVHGTPFIYPAELEGASILDADTSSRWL